MENKIVEEVLNALDFLFKKETKQDNPKTNIEFVAKLTSTPVEKILKLEKNEFEQFVERSCEEMKKKMEMIPHVILQSRLLPQNAAFFLCKWIEYLEAEKLTKMDPKILKNVKLVLSYQSNTGLYDYEYRRTNTEKTIDKVLESNKYNPKYQRSWMSTEFKPFPPFPHLNLNVINKIFSEAEKPQIKKEDLNSLESFYEVLHSLEQLCGVGEDKVTKFRERKRMNKATITAVYNGMTHKDRKLKLHKSLHHFRKYNRALTQAGRLRGRLERFFQPYITALGARVDKSGFSSMIKACDVDVRQGADVLTTVWICLTHSLFGVRKGFTLEKQQQGGLNDVQQYLLDQLKKSSTTRWDMIATIHPVPSVIGNIKEEQKWKLLQSALQLQIPMARFLMQQWEKGVNKCAEKGMMVPRRGSDVDSSGWNCVAGAWNNMIRFIRAIYSTMDEKPPLIIKCMKLLAADQMRWAEIEGKEEQVDISVFVDLSKQNITPWNIVLNKCQCSEEDIIKVCKKNGVDPKTWLGNPQERKTQMKHHGDMICGVSVPNSGAMVAILKSLGAYGYQPPNVQSK